MNIGEPLRKGAMGYRPRLGYRARMDLRDIRAVIDRSADELRADGVEAVYLFGSRARGDAGDASDIDLAFDVADGASFSLIDQGRLQQRLEHLLAKPVDFVSRRAMRASMRDRVAADMVRLL